MDYINLAWLGLLVSKHYCNRYGHTRKKVWPYECGILFVVSFNRLIALEEKFCPSYGSNFIMRFMTCTLNIKTFTRITGPTDPICDWNLENRPNCHTIGLFHYIGPANDYTCTLHIYSAIIRLTWLVCFSAASFANPINSQLRRWDLLKVLHGRHGSEIHPSERETSLMPSNHVWAYGLHFWYL